MELLEAARCGDELLLADILSAGSVDVDFKNTNYEKILSDAKQKSVYCAECYQRIKQRPTSTTTINGYVCDWPSHKRCAHIMPGTGGDVCCCDTPSGDQCNWMICPECYLTSTYDLGAPHQILSKQEGYTALIVASNQGHLPCVSLLLKMGADIELADPSGVAPLLAAVSGSRTELAKFLVASGADVNHTDNRGRTALFLAAESGDLATVQALLAAGADITIGEAGGATVLHAAAAAGSVPIMQLCIDRGLSVSATEQTGATPLHWLPTGAAAVAVRALLDRGAPVSANDAHGFTPLMYATMRNNAAAVKILINAGTTTDIAAPGWFNCLYASCLFHAPRVTEALLEAGCTMAPGQPSTLVLCARRNLISTLEVLLRHGTPVVDDALFYAAHFGRHTVLRMLLEHWDAESEEREERRLAEHQGPVATVQDDVLAITLNYACSAGHLRCVRLSLEHGADPLHRDFRGMTAMDYAQRFSKIKAVLTAHIQGEDEDALATADEDEEATHANKQHLHLALQQGTRAWNRSKIMIVGDGRAGKTALANSIMGEEFVHTESTIGINQMTCDVKCAEIGLATGVGVGTKGASSWEEYQRPDRELELALARIVAAGSLEEQGSNGEAEVEGEGGGNEEQLSGHGASSGAENGGARAEASGTATGQSASAATGPDDALASSTTMADAVQRGLVVDDALVMKYLANINTSSKYVVSLFDYGGQTVFNVIHHLFLTRYGVYTLVFNMEQLVSADPAVVAHCLDTLSFWLNSIIVHTLDGATGRTAPVFLVGTHKDAVALHSQHEHISHMLCERFSSSVAWPCVQHNSDENTTPLADTGAIGESGDVAGDATVGAVHYPATPPLCFFPVDNRRSRKDTTVVRLMSRIERCIEASEHVHTERPLSWLRCMDELHALCKGSHAAPGKAFLTLMEVTQLAVGCDVQLSDVPNMLSFLHEMGIVMWHDEPSLRDVVILDAVSYFVTPVTTIICKHVATSADSTRHLVDAHTLCNKEHYGAFMRMVHEGVVSLELIHVLLKDCGQNVPFLVRLMAKFGLIVPLRAEKGGGGGAVMEEYLVPALLPTTEEGVGREAKTGGGATTSDVPAGATTHTCLFVFTCSTSLHPSAGDSSQVLSYADTSRLGFLPRGLFERLICKAVEWCNISHSGSQDRAQSAQPTAPTSAPPPLYQDAAELRYGTQRFTLTAHYTTNCIELRVPVTDCDKSHGQSQSLDKSVPAIIHAAVSAQLRQIVSECMRSLRFFPALPYKSSSGGDTVLIPFESIKSGAVVAEEEMLRLLKVWGE